MKRFHDGYVVNGRKTLRASRRLRAAIGLGRARGMTLLIELVLFLLLGVAFFLSYRSAGRAEELLSVILALAGALLAVLGLTLVVFSVLFFTFGRAKTPEERTALATAYVRGLLVDTLPLYRDRLLSKKRGKELFEDVKSLASRFVITPEERELLLIPGRTREVGERIRMGFELFLRELCDQLSEENDRYLKMRQNMLSVMARWRRLHYPRYAKPQRLLIEENMMLIHRKITEGRGEFLRTYGLSAYFELLGDVTLYRDPSRGGKGKPLPRKEQYEAFCELTKKLRRFDTHELSMALRGEKIDEYKMLIDAYDDFEKRYATAGCPTLDIKRHRERCLGAAQDTKRCWSCKKPYHPRHREVCERCGHYVCPRCGKCHCDKHITHKVATAILED